MNRTPHVVGATQAAIAARHEAETRKAKVKAHRDQVAAVALGHPGLKAFLAHADQLVCTRVEAALLFYSSGSDPERGTQSLRSFTCSKVNDHAAKAVLRMALEDAQRIVAAGWDPSQAPRTLDREYIAAKRAAAKTKRAAAQPTAKVVPVKDELGNKMKGAGIPVGRATRAKRMAS
ncbi:MAG TPA: hypothetical protein PKV96_03075 [Candidatus Saccharimonas sp.]|nr:hypothetical protein [Candidatus Saccharimonas sp.]